MTKYPLAMNKIDTVALLVNRGLSKAQAKRLINAGAIKKQVLLGGERLTYKCVERNQWIVPGETVIKYGKHSFTKL